MAAPQAERQSEPKELQQEIRKQSEQATDRNLKEKEKYINLCLHTIIHTY